MEFFLGVFLTISFVIGLAVLAEAGAAKHWICRKCGKKVSKENMPSASGCPAGGCHVWEINY